MAPTCAATANSAIAQAQAGFKSEVAGASFAATRDDILPGLRGAIEGDGVAIAMREFDHHDSVGTGRVRLRRS